jgi:putative membrane protein
MKIIKHFVITIVINAVLLYVIANHIPELWFKISSVYQDTLIIFWALGVGFWIINSLLRSILKALTLPIKYLTLGISGLIINVLLLYVFEQLINYADVGITVSLGTLTQTFILSLIVTVVHLIVKKVV